MMIRPLNKFNIKLMCDINIVINNEYMESSTHNIVSDTFRYIG